MPRSPPPPHQPPCVPIVLYLPTPRPQPHGTAVTQCMSACSIPTSRHHPRITHHSSHLSHISHHSSYLSHISHHSSHLAHISHHSSHLAHISHHSSYFSSPILLITHHSSAHRALCSSSMWSSPCGASVCKTSKTPTPTCRPEPYLPAQRGPFS